MADSSSAGNLEEEGRKDLASLSHVSLHRSVRASEGAILRRLQLPAMLCRNSGVKLRTLWGW